MQGLCFLGMGQGEVARSSGRTESKEKKKCQKKTGAFGETDSISLPFPARKKKTAVGEVKDFYGWGRTIEKEGGRKQINLMFVKKGSRRERRVRKKTKETERRGSFNPQHARRMLTE